MHAQVVVVFVSIETNDAKNGTHTVHDDEKVKKEIYVFSRFFLLLLSLYAESYFKNHLTQLMT